MSDTQFQTDPFLRLLTDALRAGPGSPEWHDAIAKLRKDGSKQADEYRLLCEAREHLESGREYRSVRPGPAFTRQVMAKLDEEGKAKSSGIPSANIIAVVAAVAILGVIVALAAVLTHNAPPPGPGELQNTYFSSAVVSTDFTGTTNGEWRKVGSIEPVTSTRERGLRAGYSKDAEKDFRGGAIVAAAALSADKPLALEVNVHTARKTDQVLLQVFVTDSPDFSKNPEATTPQHEVVAQLRGGELTVFKADGTLGASKAVGEKTQPIRLTVKLDRIYVVVELDGQVVYAGPHGLPADTARWPGVRFIARGSEKSLEDVTVQSVRILRP